MPVAIRPGPAPLLFHRWQTAAVDAKAAAAKGSKAKKTDDVESYVYRDATGQIGLPGEYLRQSVAGPKAGSAKYRQDPRYPRASTRSLMAASVITLTDVSPIYSVSGRGRHLGLPRQRRAVRPARRHHPGPAGVLTGWTAEIALPVLQPSYLDEQLLLDLLIDAGSSSGGRRTGPPSAGSR